MTTNGIDTRTRARALALVLALTFPLAACGGRSESDVPAPAADPLAAAAQTITAADMLDRIGFLASDELRGRDTPSPGLEMAAAYIVEEFQRLGLEGGAGNGEFIQRYPFPLIGLDTTTAALAFSGAANVPTLAYGEDFLILGGEVETTTGPLVYVGPATEFAARGASAASLAGRIPVTIMAGGLDRSAQLTLVDAGSAADAAGAPTIVVVLAPDFPEATWNQLLRFTGTPRRVLGGITGIATLLLRHEAARALFSAAGVDLVAQSSNTAAAQMYIPLGSVIGTLTATRRTLGDDTAPNVVAILRGSDPALADEYVVFSAHMDHVGVGRPDATGDSIYNGADDDASGTSALIEVAEAFSGLLQRPRRSLVFLAVSGEEKGLLGSRWFSDHPTVPIEDIVANLNVDMIGRNAPDTIVVIGQEYSSLGPTVHAVARAHGELGLAVAVDPWPEERFFFRSDHFNFARKEIPALFFFAGVHEDYHQPSDEVHLIDGDKAARVARLIFHTAHAIAESPAAPQWTDEGLAEIRALTGAR